MYEYYLCGWRVGSDFLLPELAPWTGEKRPWDITIRKDTLPFRFRNPIKISPILHVTKDGAAMLIIENVATYLLTGGSDVIIDPHCPDDSPDIRVFLLGTIFGLICLRHGLFPLHASCVKINDRAIAFAGPSAAGKSTLAAALTQRGHALLADDVCVIDTNAPGGPVVLPAFPRTKLWEDSAKAINVETGQLERNRPEQSKYHFRFAGEGNFTTSPVPLHTIYLLAEENPTRPSGYSKRRGMKSVLALSDLIYRYRTAYAWGMKAKLFKTASLIADKTNVEQMVRSLDFTQLDGTAAEIEKLASQ